MTDKHEHLDEGTIHAWLDGELPPDESARVGRQAGACAECAALVAEARGLVAASSRILASLDAVPGGVIPGADTGTDQLAALRARRRETSRRWWNDRRILAAASLVFVAGVSSLVMRNAGNDAVAGRNEQEADAVVRSTTDSAAPSATAPTAAPAPRVADAPGRSEKAELSTPLRDAAPQPVAEKRALDGTSELKAVVTNPATAQRDMAAANEVGRADAILPQRAVDSISASRVARRSVFDPPLQQGVASQSQQSLRQRAAEPTPAAPPAATGAGARLGSVAATGAAASSADVVGCYRLQRPVTQGGGSTTVADSVQLFTDAIPERSDPTWYRARAMGLSADTSLAWRSVDSGTVELRSRLASNPFAVRFNIAGVPLLPAPEGGVRAVVAVRIRCP